MRYVFAAARERMVEECRDSLNAYEGLEFRAGSVADTGWDCKAAIVSFPLAHDRYGGTPQIGHPQVLTNTRGDGAPGIILATPPLLLSSASPAPSDADIAKSVHDIMDSCITAYIAAYTPAQDSKVLVHLEAAGIDRPDLTPVLIAIASFLSKSDPS